MAKMDLSIPRSDPMPHIALDELPPEQIAAAFGLDVETIREAFDAVLQEMIHAFAKHGFHKSNFNPDNPLWLPNIGEEFGEVCATQTYDKDASELSDELIDLAAVALARWVALRAGSKEEGQ